MFNGSLRTICRVRRACHYVILTDNRSHPSYCTIARIHSDTKHHMLCFKPVRLVNPLYINISIPVVGSCQQQNLALLIDWARWVPWCRPTKCETEMQLEWCIRLAKYAHIHWCLYSNYSSRQSNNKPRHKLGNVWMNKVYTWVLAAWIKQKPWA